VAETAPSGERPDADLIRSLEAADIHPLWDRYQQITPIEPSATDAARIWRWRDFEPFTARAAAEVPVEDVERRALIMANPDFGGQTVTTQNLLSAFTVLEPGDRAVPHRHTAAAIRFSTRAEGAATIVNGRRCDMLPGDLILTPPMCWHGHINDSDHRIMWFDAANIPLMNTLDANFFEPGSREDNAFWQVDEGDERLWDAAGLVSEGAGSAASHSPKYRYPGAATRRLLAASAPGPDGSRTVRYVNPVTGGSVMTTLDCYAVRLPDDAATQAKRGTWNAICLVVDGEGRSTVGGEMFEWSRHDVFTIPHWTWATHEAVGGEADLLVVTDRAVHERLDLVRQELR
jgi:gentisate 1,2-dioxygenase